MKEEIIPLCFPFLIRRSAFAVIVRPVTDAASPVENLLFYSEVFFRRAIIYLNTIGADRGAFIFIFRVRREDIWRLHWFAICSP